MQQMLQVGSRGLIDTFVGQLLHQLRVSCLTSRHSSSMAAVFGKLCLLIPVFALITLVLGEIFIVKAWTGEIRGRVVCDVCGDSSIGPEDHVLVGAEVAVLCITKSGEVLNYQAFTDSKGVYTVAETMPEADRWNSCLARPIRSFHEHCTQLRDSNTGAKFIYNHPSGYYHPVKPFVYRQNNIPSYCS